MQLIAQRRVAARILGVGSDRVWMDPERLEDVKQAITAEDIRRLISQGVIRAERVQGVSRARANRLHRQKVKGRRRGHGSHKGSATARQPRKEAWMLRIRAQRKLLRQLLEEGRISREAYREVYRKAKGGVFRSKKHVLLYLREHHEIREESAEQTQKA